MCWSPDSNLVPFEYFYCLRLYQLSQKVYTAILVVIFALLSLFILNIFYCWFPTYRWQTMRWSPLEGGGGGFLARCGGVATIRDNASITLRLVERQTLILHTYWKSQAFRGVRSGLVRCANVFRMVSSNSSFVTKTYACAPVECPARIIFSVEYTTCKAPVLL